MHNSADALQIFWKILLVLGLVLLNGFFVAAEFALVRIRETQLDALVFRALRRAKVARHILANLNSFLSATQLGITMASLGLGWVGERFFSAHFFAHYRRGTGPEMVGDSETGSDCPLGGPAAPMVLLGVLSIWMAAKS